MLSKMYLIFVLAATPNRYPRNERGARATCNHVSVTWKCFDALISTGGTWIDTADGHKVILALSQVRVHFIYKITPSPLRIKTNPYILPVLQS